MKSKYLFTSHNSVIHPLISYLSKKKDVVILDSDDKKNMSIGDAKIRIIEYGNFGLAKIFNLFRLEFTTPTYIFNLKKHLELESPEVIIQLDFHKIIFLQTLLYKRFNRNTKIYLLSETKRWPKNIFAKTGMYLFWIVLKINKSSLEKIIVYNNDSKDFFYNRIKGVSICVLPPIINDDNFFQKNKDTFSVNGKLRILMNARYVKYKNHLDLILAVKKISKNIPNIEIGLIGNGGDYKLKISRQINSLGMKDKVYFLDSVTKDIIVNIYQRYDLLVLPSYNEAVGMVVPEAMLCGIPTITSDTVGANVYVKDGETGFIFRTGDVEDLADKIISISNDYKLKDFGQKARNRILNNFTLDKMRPKINEYFEL
jgi:glycosyltransferase involved in cell wall biosynthesis